MAGKLFWPLVGGRQRFFPHVGLPTRLLECLHGMVSGLLRCAIQETKVEAAMLFWPSLSSHTPALQQCSTGHRRQPFLMSEGATQRHEYFTARLTAGHVGDQPPHQLSKPSRMESQHWGQSAY